MRNIYLIHALWVLVAAGAFAIGRFQAPARSDSSGNSTGSAKSTARSGASYRSESPAPGAGRPGTHRNAPGPRSSREIPSGAVLSSAAMQEAMTSILAGTDPIKRQRRFTELLESLTPGNAEAAVRALREAPRSRWNWGQEYSLLTYAWGRIDGPAAVAFAKQQEGRTREWTMSSVLAGWASNNPEEAKKWVAAIEDKEEQRNFTRGLVYGLAQRDVEAATSYVFSLPQTDDNRPADYISHIARQQLSQGVETAAEWTTSLPDGRLKGSALETVAGEYVRRDPEKAAQWASQFAEDEYAAGAIAEISDEWAEDDPQSALEWVTTLPEGNTRSRALGETISEWARDKPAEAGQYLAAMPSGPERDTAISYYSRRVVYQEPAAAIEWAQSIGSQELRHQTVTRTAREWLQRDVSAASAWLESAGLPEPVVQEILKPREDGDRRDWRRRR